VTSQAGFTVIDDLVHGFGGGYLQPDRRTPPVTIDRMSYCRDWRF